MPKYVEEALVLLLMGIAALFALATFEFVGMINP